ncbi:MAG: hypothetical protein IH571_05480, partial [Acholeplasmataceae bacterium]|nr:hypothetical protein [Acholeplasmataceae bacterium]
MRFLFKLIVLPILSIIFVPLMILIFAYKPVEIPVDDFDLNETINLTSMITEQMDIFLEENDQDSEIGIGFSQQQAN